METPNTFANLGARLLAAFDASDVAYGLFDAEDRLRVANAALLSMLHTTLDGAPTWEQIMRDCHRSGEGVMIDTRDIDTWISDVRRRYRKAPVRTFETDLCDGRWMWVTETTFADGCLLLQASEVSPLKANEATLRHSRDQAVMASLTDALTGLHNRRFVMRRLDDLLASARQMRIPLSIAMLDLDNFKRVNDLHGHDVGDQVLRGFASLLKHHVRPLDTAGRLGGEEFLLLLPNTSPTGAAELLGRLRRALREAPLVPEIPSLQTSFSAGVTLADPAEMPLELLKRADRALYTAKDLGRNTDFVLRGPHGPGKSDQKRD